MDRRSEWQTAFLVIRIFPLRERRNGIGPGLDLCPDRVVLVRGEGHLAPGERQVVQLPVRVMALDGCRLRLGVGVPGCRSPVGRGKRGVGKQGCGTGIETGDGVELVGIAPDYFGVAVLVDDLYNVTLLSSRPARGLCRR